MNIDEFRKMATNYWDQQYDKHSFVPPEAKFVTGLAKNDAFFHHMLVEHGVEMVLEQLTRSSWRLVDYRIVDEKKWGWFLLRWV